MSSSNNPPLTLYLSLTSSPSTPRIALTLDDDGAHTTAAVLRRRAAAATSVPLASLKLIFRGRVIADKAEGDVVREFKLEHESVVHVMGKPSAGAPAAGGGAGVAAGASAPTATGASVAPPAGGSATGATSESGAAAPVQAALAKLRSSNDGPTFRTALATADKLLGNIVAHPMEEKYRTIKKSNPAFAKRLGGVPGGSDLLAAASFNLLTKDGVEYHVLAPSADAWPRLVAAREAVGRMLAGEGTGRAAAPPAAALVGPTGMPGPFSAGLPGGGTGGGPGNVDAMQSMLSDPNMLQNVMGMMNNPMVQNMMQNDPRFANNPMLQQAMQALQSSPEMMQQFSQMMGDPNMRERMSTMMQQQQQPAAGGGGADPFGTGPEAMRRQMEQFQRMSQQHGGTSGAFNAGGGAGGGAVAAGQGGTAGASTAGADTAAAGGGADRDMTEEEMIAEAIARSLRES